MEMRPDASVLLVDDDDDTRELLGVMLSMAGYRVRQAGDAEGALRCLREGGYQLLITDYDLPGRTGAQLMHEARRDGLLSDCAVLVVTAHPEPEGLGEAPVMHKPLDVEAFRKQVDRILERHSSEHPSAAPAVEPGVPIVLYVERGSPASQRAERNFRQILASVSSSTVRVEVRDVVEHAQEAEADRVVFIPTLVAKCDPPVWIVGDLRQREPVVAVLALCGIRAPESPP